MRDDIIRAMRSLYHQPERELTRKPLRIDFLILKKDGGWHMKSRLGRLLKNHTILEYKGATDRLGIDDIYKGMAYISLYLSSGKQIS